VGTELVRYDAMCRAIDAAYEVDEVKDIRDKALAIEVYAKQAKNTEAERRACEIRLRAERKAGQLRREEEKNKGGRPAKNPCPGGAQVLTNAERREHLGITEKQDRQWQALAAVPEEQFEAALAAPGKPSTNGIIGKKQPTIDPHALFVWGRLRDFERDGLLNLDQTDLFAEITDAMRADIRRLAPLVSEWLKGAGDACQEEG
jgi:hypothetical protein